MAGVRKGIQYKKATKLKMSLLAMMCLVFSGASLLAQTALSGTYTVGGSNPDFSTLQAAVDSLTSAGMSDTVRLLMRDGEYDEYIQITAIAGMRTSQPLMIVGEKGSESDVRWKNSNSSDGRTLLLDGVSGFHLRNIQLESTSRCVYIKNATGHLEISDCHLIAGTYGAGVYYGNAKDTISAKLFNNTVVNGGYGFYLKGNGTDSEFDVRNNFFTNHRNTTILITNARKCEVEQNEMTSESINATCINIESCSNVSVQSNQLRSKGIKGISIYKPEGTVAIANNFVHLDGSGAEKGIDLRTVTEAHPSIYFNTVKIDQSTKGTNSCLYLSENIADTTTVKVRNNVLYNSSLNGYNLIWSSGILDSDYNSFYNTSGALMKDVSSAEMADLTAWQAAGYGDSHSYQADPVFKSGTDLHVNALHLDQAGIVIPGYDTDIDGEARQTPPDIGADEFTREPDHLSLVEFVNPVMPFRSGNNTISVRVRNDGANDITAFAVKWKVNDEAYQDYNWTGTITPGELAVVEVGDYDFQNKLYYDLQVLPQSVNEGAQSGDTLKADSLIAGYGGNYTVGGNAPDFDSLTTALREIKTGGLADTVRLMVRDGTYDESILIESVMGMSASTPLIITAEKGADADVSYTNTGEDWIFGLNELDGLHIEYLKLTSTRHAVYGLQNIGTLRITNCEMVLGNAGQGLGFSYTKRAEKVEFNNNKVTNGDKGLSVAYAEVEARNNVFEEQTGSAIFIDDGTACQIDGNEIYSTQGNHNGIYLRRSKNLMIQNNKIKSEGLRGIYLSSLIKGETPDTIVNNFVHLPETVAQYGISLEYGTEANAHVYFNTVKIDQSTKSTNSGLYSTLGIGNKLTLKNNVLSNTSTNGWALSIESAELDTDYNLFFNSGSSLVKKESTSYQDLTEWKNSNSGDSHSYQSDPQFLDEHDLHVRSIDLNQSGTTIDGITHDIDGELRQSPPDIGADEFTPGGNRVGLEHYENPVMPFDPGVQKIILQVKNEGSSPLTKFKVKWRVNAEAYQDYSWQGSVASGSIASVEVGQYEFLTGQVYSLTTMVVSANEEEVTGSTGDTLIAQLLMPGYSGDYTVGGEAPDFETLTNAIEAISLGGITDSVRLLIRDGEYSESVTIPAILGMSPNRTLTIRSASGDASKVSYNTTSTGKTRVFEIAGVDGLRFQDLTINNSNDAIYLTGDIGHLMVNRCVINVSQYGVNARYNKAVSIDFRNSKVTNGSYAVYMEGIRDQSTLFFKNNELTDQSATSVYARYLNEAEIEKNIIESVKSGSIVRGIYLGYCTNIQVMGNQIQNAGVKGIEIYRPEEGQNPVLIANNFIHLTGVQARQGIFINTSKVLVPKVYFNTVKIDQSTYRGNTCLHTQLASNDTLFLKNNILYNSSSGGYTVVWYTSKLESDHNSFFNQGSDLMRVGSNSGIADLEAWQNLTNGDANSLVIDPKFVAADDLHATNGTLYQAGVKIDEITHDIDDEVRQDPPVIGADEFLPSGVNAAAISLEYPEMPFGKGEHDLQLKVENAGFDEITELKIVWRVNTDRMDTVTWNGSLSRGAQVDVPLGKYDFQPLNKHEIVATIVFANGVHDEDLGDNEIAVEDLVPMMSAGSYTIGGQSPDFNTFVSAVDATQMGGIEGDIIFEVRDGQYEEKVYVDQPLNSSCQHTVVFRPETGDTASVKLTGDGISSPTLTLKSTTGFVFRNISILNSQGTVIEMKEEAECNRFESCLIEGVYQPNSKLVEIGNDCDNNSFDQNTFKKGEFGLYATQADSIKVINNVWLDQLKTAIRFRESANSVIDKNVLMADTSSTIDAYGIALYTPKSSCKVTNNKMDLRNKTGVYFYQYSNLTEAYWIANNMIHVDGDREVVGLEINNIRENKVVFNSVHVSNTHPESKGMYWRSLNQTGVFKNNIFVNSGGGKAIRVDGTSKSSGFSADHNCYHASGEYWGENSQDGEINDLAIWQARFSWESNSLIVSPQFVSDTDLHVNQAMLNQAGEAIYRIATDIDGEPRGAVPDIGADEFTPAGKDVMILPVELPIMPFVAGSYPITVNVVNAGFEEVDSLHLDWTLNGIDQSTVLSVDTLQSGDTVSFSLGDFNFEEETFYSFHFEVSIPEQEIDLTNNVYQSDSLISAVLAGDYTVGGTSPDYQKIADAADAVAQRGIAGSVRFLIRPGVYEEPIVFGNVKGADCTRQVTFRSEAEDSVSVVWQATNGFDDYVVRFDQAKGYKIEALTLKNPNGKVVEIGEEVACITFESTILTGVEAGSSIDHSIVYSNTVDVPVQQIRFLNSRFVDGAYGVYAVSGNSLGDDLLIQSNEFSNQTIEGIHVHSFGNVAIIGNEIKTAENALTAQKGVSVSVIEDELSIAQNKIIVHEGSGIYGSSIYNATGKLIANNFVSIGGTNRSRGIEFSGARALCAYNSVNISNTETTSSAIYVGNGNIALRNNILVNTGGGYAYHSGTSIIDADFNDLYVTGDNIGYFNGDIATITDWQIGTGGDQNSVSIDPTFVSNTDLHVQNIALDGIGTPVAEVSVDIDGNARHASTPDIGADEFDAYSIDTYIQELVWEDDVLIEGRRAVRAKLVNGGSTQLDSVDVHWSVNGKEQVMQTWVGTLQEKGAIDVELGEFDFRVGKDYDVRVWTRYPNSQSDQNPANDTLVVLNLYPALLGEYTVGEFSADIADLRSAVDFMEKGGVAGPVTFSIKDGEYNEGLKVSPIEGLSVQNTLTFKSESGDASQVVLMDVEEGANGVIVLEGVGHVVFENLTVVSNGEGIKAWKSSNQISIKGCVFSSESHSQHIVLEGVENGILEGNDFIGGSIGVSQSNFGVTTKGTFHLINNRFIDQSEEGVRIRDIGDLILTANTFDSDTRNPLYEAVNVFGLGGELTISENHILLEGRGKAMNLHNIRTSGKVYNNMIACRAEDNEVGIELRNCTQLELSNNSVNVHGNNAAFKLLSIELAQGVHLKNNIFSNQAGGTTIWMVDDTGEWTSDYNDLYTSGEYLARYRLLRADLSDWQIATLQDVNSLSIDPVFDTKRDLHLYTDELAGAGTKVSYVTKDIDGEDRVVRHPDIGADEFSGTSISRDIGVAAILEEEESCRWSANENIKVMIKNFGVEAASAFDVSCLINDSLLITENVGAAIVAGRDTLIYEFKTSVNLKAYSSINIQAYTSLENDLRPNNDKSEMEVTIYPDLNYSMTQDVAVCQDSKLELTATAESATFEWEGQVTGDSIYVVYPASDQTYRLTMIDQYGCVYTDSVEVTTIPPSADVPTAVSGMWPEDNAVNLGVPLKLSWIPGKYTINYDVYMWEQDSLKPEEPMLTDLSEINVLVNELKFNTTYKWQVVSKNKCSSSESGLGPVQSFTMKDLSDLVVDTAGVLETPFSGQEIEVVWDVKNTGKGATGVNTVWLDHVYVSMDSTISGGDIRLGSSYNTLALQSGEVYRNSATIKLPDDYVGEYYIIIQANANRREAESDFTNNQRVFRMDIQLSPPPDLQVTKIYPPGVNGFAFAGQKVQISWVTNNLGEGAITSDAICEDRVYWSESDTYDPTAVNTIDRTNYSVSKVRMPEDAYQQTIHFNIPEDYSGIVYFYVETDREDDVFEHLNEDNNVTRSQPLDIILTPPPDLKVTSSNVEELEFELGRTLEFEYQTINQGGIRTDQSYWFDSIYISQQDTLDASAIPLGREHNKGVLSVDQERTSRIDIKIPVIPTGNYNLFVTTDVADVVYEGNHDRNNFYSVPIKVKTGPTADLVPEINTDLPDSLTAGSTWPFSFTITNEGKAPTYSKEWTDKVFISTSETWDSYSAIALDTSSRFLTVEEDGEYTVNTEIRFPISFLLEAGGDSSHYIYVYVGTDVEDQVYEGNDENNNVVRSEKIYVKYPDPVDMEVLSATSSATDTVYDGDQYTLGWKIRNNGNTTSDWDYPLWHDALYLSKDVVLDSTDVFIDDWTKNGPLDQEDEYVRHKSFTVPYEMEGEYYLLFVADYKNNTNDENQDNNVRIVNGSGIGDGKILIQRKKRPDLVVESFHTPDMGVAGQPVRVIWTIKNEGEAGNSLPYTNRFYISVNEDRGQIIGNAVTQSSLDIGESYTDTTEVTIPGNFSGNYYIQIETDALKRIFETNEGEKNNEAHAFIKILPQEPSDLIVQNIQLGGAASYQPWDLLKVDYTIKNTGDNAATGTRKDIVYLSKNSTLSSDDAVLSVDTYRAHLVPAVGRTVEKEVHVPGVLPGQYSVLVKVDALNNIAEANDDNNVKAAIAKVEVTLPELRFDIPEQRALWDIRNGYYELNIPEDLAGETMVISLTTDKPVSHNELYLSYQQMPTLTEADYMHRFALQGNQELVVEKLKAGAYYLMIHGNASSDGVQEVNVLAKILPFEIRSVDANQGGNTGNVTVKIEGAKFAKDMVARLEQGNVEIDAHTIYYLNSTEIYASFDLKGASRGMYDVVLINELEEARLANGFEVVTGSTGGSNSSGGSDGNGSSEDFSCEIRYNAGVSNLLEETIDHPGSVRSNRTVELNIYFQNNGNVDIPIQNRFLFSVSGHPVAFEIDDIEKNLQHLFIEFKEENGPPGILRPGAGGIVRAYTRSGRSGVTIDLILSE